MGKDENLLKPRKRLFNINLQLFNDGMFSGIEGVNPILADPEPEPIPEPVADEPPVADPEPVIDDPSPEPPAEPAPAEPQVDFNAMFSQLKEDIANGFKQITPEPTPEEPKPEPTPEEVEAQREEFLSKLMENPEDIINQKAMEIANKMFDDKIARLQEQNHEQQTWVEKARNFFDTHKDVNAQDIQNILSEKQYLLNSENPYEEAYKLLKFDDVKTQATPKTFEEMLQDEANMAKVLENPALRQKVLESLKNNNAPVVMGGKQGQVSVTPENKPKSFSEATRMWMDSTK